MIGVTIQDVVATFCFHHRHGLVQGNRYLFGHPFPVSEANEIHCAEAMNLGCPKGDLFREGGGGLGRPVKRSNIIGLERLRGRQ